MGTGKILGFSLIAITALTLIPGLKVGVSGYFSSLGGGKFNYRFDKTRLPAFAIALAVLAVVSFIYALIVGRDVQAALLFCGLATLFASIGCMLSICYVRK